MNARNTTGKLRFVRDRDWTLYETGELYDLSIDLDEEFAIYESADSEASASARARLRRVFRRGNGVTVGASLVGALRAGVGDRATTRVAPTDSLTMRIWQIVGASLVGALCKEKPKCTSTGGYSG